MDESFGPPSDQRNASVYLQQNNKHAENAPQVFREKFHILHFYRVSIKRQKVCLRV